MIRTKRDVSLESAGGKLTHLGGLREVSSTRHHPQTLLFPSKVSNLGQRQSIVKKLRKHSISQTRNENDSCVVNRGKPKSIVRGGTKVYGLRRKTSNARSVKGSFMLPTASSWEWTSAKEYESRLRSNLIRKSKKPKVNSSVASQKSFYGSFQQPEEVRKPSRNKSQSIVAVQSSRNRSIMASTKHINRLSQYSRDRTSSTIQRLENLQPSKSFNEIHRPNNLKTKAQNFSRLDLPQVKRPSISSRYETPRTSDALFQAYGTDILDTLWL